MDARRHCRNESDHRELESVVPQERRTTFELLAGRDHSDHPELANWHGNIGKPVALDLAPPAPPVITGIDVLCWNVAIGKGHLDELISRLHSNEMGCIGTDPQRPLVLLLQEAYRADPTVPEHPIDHFHGGHVPVGTRRDIVDFAAEHKLSLRYAPSMRNGHHRSDRGNAILSTVEIGGGRAFVLPYIQQRRVVVKIELEGLPWLTFVCAHLDTAGRLPGTRLSPFAGRAAQSSEMIRRLNDMNGPQNFILGADLNTAVGTRDPAFRVFLKAGLIRASGSELIRHTFHGPRPLRLLLDHLLYRSPDKRIDRCEVIRLDEVPGDNRRAIFGSDHHPLLARLTLAPARA